jgi:hypothetical protein
MAVVARRSLAGAVVVPTRRGAASAGHPCTGLLMLHHRHETCRPRPSLASRRQLHLLMLALQTDDPSARSSAERSRHAARSVPQHQENNLRSTVYHILRTQSAVLDCSTPRLSGPPRPCRWLVSPLVTDSPGGAGGRPTPCGRVAFVEQVEAG